MRPGAVRLVLALAALALACAAPAEAAQPAKQKAHVAKKHAAGKKTARPQAVRTSGSNDVYFQGHYLGSDPDPRIRYELNRDLGKYFGGDD